MKNLNENILRLKTLMGILTENDNEELTPEIETKLANELKKFGESSFEIKIVDKRSNKTKKLNVSLTNNPEDPITINNLEEGPIKNIIMGVVCTIAASGMVSCKKSEKTWAYNINYKAITYNTKEGTPNKTITINTPSGSETVQVDSTKGKLKDYWASSGVIYNRPLTKTEIYIIKAGTEYSREKMRNNKQGYDPDLVYDITPENIKFSQEEYEDVPGDDPRSTVTFKEGLEYLKQKGENVSELMSKANQELSKQEFITDRTF